jgi:hypothetical protein
MRSEFLVITVKNGEGLSNAEAARRLCGEISPLPIFLSTYLNGCCPAFTGLWYLLLVLPTPIEPVQDLAVFWTWSLKFYKLSRKNLMDVSSFTIWRALHEQGLHPYHLQRVQHLKPEDPPRRIAFCQ